MTNKRFVVAGRPSGETLSEQIFKFETAPIPALAEGQVLVRTLYLSLDPYMRARVSAAQSYAASVPIGGVMIGEVVGEIVESRSPGLRAGDRVLARSGWQTYAALPSDQVEPIEPGAFPMSYYLGVLGMPGATAYFALNELGKPQSGETVVISAAAGAVGQVAGQLAKALGCRVIGVAGSDEKLAYVRDELKFDAVCNYKNKDYETLAKEVEHAAPNGVNVFFDNVGGVTHDAAMRNLALRARVIICGVISTKPEKLDIGIRWYRQLLIKRASVHGFLVDDFRPRWGEFRQTMAGLLTQGKVRYREHVVDGLENAPKALIGLLAGENFGKLLVKVAA